MKTTFPDKAVKATGHVTLSPTGVLQIKFPYDPLIVAKVKTLSMRNWHPGPKHWTAPASVENILKLRDWGFALDKAVTAPHVKEIAIRTTEPIRKKLDLGELATALDEYQIEGVQMIENFNGRALIADDPGLGKTPQCLAWLRAHPELRPAVIIPKASGKLVWKRIAEKGILPEGHDDFVPLLPNERIQVIYGEKPVEIDADVIIVNYDILAVVEDCPDCSGEGERSGMKCRACRGKGEIARMRADIAAINPKVVILDEPQQICNREAQRSQATIEFAAKPRYIIAATASPIKNRPKEFFNILNLIRPDLFPSFWSYAKRYCGAVHNGFGWNLNGASNLAELYAILDRELMIRRSKESVMGKLALNRQVIPLEIDNRKEYNAASKDFLEWLWQKGDNERFDRARRAETLTKISALLRLASEGKTKMVIEWISDFLESEKKLLVFTRHTALLNTIIARFSKIAVKIDGSTSPKQRQEAEDRFQNDPECLLLVGNSEAAGDTITLTAAHDVAFAELPKGPEDVKQNEGRAYGRKNNPHGINSFFLVAADTIEEERADQLNAKARVISQVLDGVIQSEDEQLIELAGRMKK